MICTYLKLINFILRKLINTNISTKRVLWIMGKLNMYNEISTFAKECVNHVIHLNSLFIKDININIDIMDNYISANWITPAASMASNISMITIVAASPNYTNERKWQKNKLMEILK